ncbi:MAG: hypothetical protein ACR2J6_02105 [Thermoleophilaceae bacterium]
MLHRERVNNLNIQAGAYLTFAKSSALTCSELSQHFRRFLGRDTPRGYSLNPATGTFLDRGTPIFRVKPASPQVSGQPATG